MSRSTDRLTLAMIGPITKSLVWSRLARDRRTRKGYFYIFLELLISAQRASFIPFQPFLLSTTVET